MLVLLLLLLFVFSYCEQHLLLVWAVTMVMIECHASEIHHEYFITGVVMVTVHLNYRIYILLNLLQ